ncbi:hypothetical protein AGLY_013897, partial [Aphis glycines]
MRVYSIIFTTSLNSDEKLDYRFRQIVEGLYSRDLCNYLLARNHLSENELLSDLRAFDTVNVVHGVNQSKNNKVNQHLTTNYRPAYSSAKSSNNRKQKDLSQITCFNCKSLGHFANMCPTRICQKCHNLGHSERSCTELFHQQNDGIGENVSLLERSPPCIVPPYMISLTIKYLNGRNFLSHPRIILGVENGQFLINFNNKSDNISFEEILSINFNDENNDNLEIIDFSRTIDNNEDNNDNKVYPEMIIQLKSDKIFYFKPRRLSFYEKECLQKILDN